jgi:hypothetical protein
VGSALSSRPYSPECVEVELCELRLYGSPEKVYEGAAPLLEEPRPHTLLALSSRIYLVVRSQPQSEF